MLKSALLLTTLVATLSIPVSVLAQGLKPLPSNPTTRGIQPAIEHFVPNPGRQPKTASTTAIPNRPKPIFLTAQERAKIATQAAIRMQDLQNRLRTFKDPKKASVAATINTTLSQINKKATDEMNQKITKISDLLTRIQNKISADTTSGRDYSTVNTALAAAQADVSTATQAVSDQSVKDYTVTITSESSARTDIKTTRDQLQSDLKTTRETVETARQSAISVVEALAGILGGETSGTK